MRKARWIFAFLVLFFIGDRIGGWILSKLVEKSQFRYTRLYQNQAAADILLLGNSRGLIFYQPYIEAITGKKTFNFSYNSMPIDLGRALVEDYLQKYPKPNLLLIDVTLCDRYNEKLIAGFSTYSTYSQRLNDLIKKVSVNSWYGSQISHLYRYNSEVFQRTMRYINRTDEDWLTDRQISKTMQEQVNQAEVVELEIDSILLNELTQLIQTAENKGVKVELVVSPYYPDYVKRLQKFYDFIGKIEAGTNKKVRDYSRALQDVNGFGDYQHLNKEGSKQFIDLMKQDGVFEY